MNKQQKNYIKAVVGFVLAAIILCAGIMTALYLMREEKGMENLMAPVLKRLIAGILLFGLTVCWRHFLKKSVSKVAGIIAIVLLSLFFAWHISGIPQEKALKPQNVNLEKAEFRGYEINGNHFLIKEARPFIKYKMQSSKIANVKVYFAEPVAQDTDVKISYQTKEKPTYEQNPRVWANIKKGEKIAFGEVDATGITRIKVRFGSKIGQQFVLDHIELNANYRERVQKKQITMIKKTDKIILLVGLMGSGKTSVGKRLAKKLNLDAIHDTVHEMCKDEARHGKGFEGLYNRYFKK